MKIIVAPDSYKGALRAGAVAEAIIAGWKTFFPGDELLAIPLSDGGEGLAEALGNAMDAAAVTVPAHDALMRPVTARAMISGDTAIVESAEANGIELIRKSELDPLAATTYGVGEIISALLDAGCRKFIIGIGGSATVDGGAGMFQALGGKLYDPRGKLLPPGAGGGVIRNVAAIDRSALDARLNECDFSVACDVTNPLCGANGAAPVFAPQKGATPEMAASLDRNLAHWAQLNGDSGTVPGDGAAGGLGFALRTFLNARMVSGAELVMHHSGFIRALSGADLVITGEGCSDNQTAFGKLCACVANAAHGHNVPAVLLSGALKGDISALETLFDGCFSIASAPCTLDDAIAATGKNLTRAGANLAKLWHAAGRKI